MADIIGWTSWLDSMLFTKFEEGTDVCTDRITAALLPYNGYFLRLEIFAIWAPKRSILIFAFLIFAITFNREKWLIDRYFHTWILFSSAVIKYFLKRLNIVIVVVNYGIISI